MIKGNEQLLQQTGNAGFVGLSIISVIEFLSFPGITEEDKKLLFELIEEMEVISLNMNDTSLLAIIAQTRSTYKLKLPDAVIAATAIYTNATLITNDKHFQNINSLSILQF